MLPCARLHQQPTWEAGRKCSYPCRMKAMLRLPRWLGVWLAVSLAAAGCAADWTGSVGAVFGRDNHDGRIYVREVPSDMSAARSGLLIDDEIVAIDGRPVKGMSPDEVHAALTGKVGTKVILRVVRAGTTLDVAVERGPLRAAPTGPPPEPSQLKG
jgi:S1-C subfamily serine protease